MNKSLSQIIADILTKPTEGVEPSSRVQHLGNEIRKVVQSEDTMIGRFNGLLESLSEILPDEQQRYQAALRALSVTTKMNRQEIFKAMSGQLEELTKVDAVLMTARSGRGIDGQKGMEARSQQLKGELAQLRGRLAQLESEEKSVHAGMAAWEKDLALAEKTVKDLFYAIGSEIGSVQKKVEELTVEATASGPAPPAEMPGPKEEPQTSDAPGKQKEGEQAVAIRAVSPRKDAKSQRKCPLCGARFHLLELGRKWQCFTCAYEEPATDAVPDTTEEMSEPVITPAPAFEAASSSGQPAPLVDEPEGPIKEGSRSGSKTGGMKKSCPFCFKKMTWFPGEKAWRCPSGHYEKKVGPGPGSRG